MNRFKRISASFVAAVLTLSSLMTLGFTGVAHAAVQTCTWTGTAGDDTFSTAGNWSNCGGSVPLAGDIILFNSVPAGNYINLTNDLGVILGGIVSAPVSDNAGYDIDTLTLASGSLAKVTQRTDCNQQNLSLTVDDLISSGDVTSDGVAITKVEVGGDLTQVSSGTLQADAGSFVSGSMIVSSPTQAVVDCPASGGGSGTQPELTVHDLMVQKSASIPVTNASYPITLGGGTGTNAPILYFYAQTDSNFASVPSTYNISGDITLSDDAQFFVDSGVTVNITGTINGVGHKITRAAGSQGVLVNQASADNSNTGTGTQENTAKTTTLSDAQPTANVEVSNKETTIIDGTRGAVSVDTGGVLKGTGTVQSIFAANGSIVAPGHSPGTLTVTDSLGLASGSIYQAELQTKDSYDQLVVGSTSRPGPDVSLSSSGGSAILSVSLYDGFKIAKGDTFTIINNVSPGAVQGTFKDLAEGASFKVGNGVFSITYKGGDGNDVVLTALTVPTTPDTGFALVGAHPGATLAVTVAAAGAIMVLARRMRPAPVRIRAKASRRR